MGKSRKKTVPDGTIAATVLQAANTQREEKKKRKNEDNPTKTSEPSTKKVKTSDKKKKESFKPKEERKSKEQIKIIIAAKQKRIEKRDKKARDARDKLDSHPYLQSIEYLRQWKNDRDNWGFKKVRQIWLLQHIYHETQMIDDDFAILVEYLAGLKGKSRDVTLKEAQDIIKAAEGEKESDSSESDSSDSSDSDSEEDEEKSKDEKSEKKAKKTKKPKEKPEKEPVEKPSEKKLQRAKKIIEILSE